MVDYSEALGKRKKIIFHYNGLFDFDGMYAAIIGGLNYGFLWQEVDYKHKVPNPKDEVEFKWSLTKNVTDYISNEIGILHMWDLLEVSRCGWKKKILSMPAFICGWKKDKL